MFEFGDEYSSAKVEALIDIVWTTMSVHLSVIKRAEFDNEHGLNNWSDEVSSFFIMLKLLRKRIVGRTGLKGSLQNTIEKLIVFRPVILFN